MASSFPKSLDTIFDASDAFAKKVSDMSGGKFTISTHAGGELMPPFRVVGGVQNGTVEMAHTAHITFTAWMKPSHLAARFPSVSTAAR